MTILQQSSIDGCIVKRHSSAVITCSIVEDGSPYNSDSPRAEAEDFVSAGDGAEDFVSEEVVPAEVEDPV